MYGECIDSVNTTGRSTFKRWVVQTSADVVRVQETGIDAEEAIHMCSWCANRGWRMICARAARAVKIVAVIVKLADIGL